MVLLPVAVVHTTVVLPILVLRMCSSSCCAASRSQWPSRRSQAVLFVVALVFVVLSVVIIT